MNLQIKLVIFTVDKGKLWLYREKNALPTQGIQRGISLDAIAQSIFKKIGDIPREAVYMEQLYTFSGKEIVIGYYVLVPSHLLQVSHQWMSSEYIGKAASFDREVVQYAIQRLRWKIEYTNLVYSLLPHDFTLSELQEVYEVILGRILDKRNFRKKILSLHLVKATGKMTRGLATRPAQVYTFRKRSPVRVRVF